MAANSFRLFIHQLQAADDELKVKVAQIVFDLLMVQDIQELVSKTMPVSPSERYRRQRKLKEKRAIKSSSWSA